MSHMVMLSQKVARRWKSHVPPVPAWFGLTVEFFGRVTKYVRSLPPVPGRFDVNCTVGSSWPV